VNDNPAQANLREAFMILNRDYQLSSQRAADQLSDHERRLTRGGEKFAKIDLQMQAIEAAINGLRTDYSRAMAEIERLQARIAQLDAQLGATLRLANRVQQDLAALQKEHDALRHIVIGERGNDEDRGMEGDMSTLRAAVRLFAVVLVVLALGVLALFLARGL
jgi:chromosome segregation ATPase